MRFRCRLRRRLLSLEAGLFCPRFLFLPLLLPLVLPMPLEPALLASRSAGVEGDEASGAGDAGERGEEGADGDLEPTVSDRSYGSSNRASEALIRSLLLVSRSA